MIAYLDTSACAKLLVSGEPGAAALVDYLTSRDDDRDLLVSSQLLETELRRMASRKSLPQAAVTEILARVNLILPERDFFHEAGLLPGAHLRSLDALHLATAISAEADVLVAYDHRMLEAAASVGIAVTSPG